jgi:SOS response regulatory protein OraA/RecX
MRQKGLDNAAIAQALNGIDESDSAYRAGAARAQRWYGLEQREFLQKMIPFLVRRGFDWCSQNATAVYGTTGKRSRTWI